jgi:hypothetical protein
MSYKALFALAAANDLEIEQMDVKTAFLYGNVEEQIYIYQPEGFDDRTGGFAVSTKLYTASNSPCVCGTKHSPNFLSKEAFLHSLLIRLFLSKIHSTLLSMLTTCSSLGLVFLKSMPKKLFFLYDSLCRILVLFPIISA